MIVDSHCHLADDAFAEDRGAVIARARAAGVGAALCILSADDAAEVMQAAELTAAWPELRLATGVHPHRAGVYADEPGRAGSMARSAIERCGAAALGEVGLDYHYDFAPPAVQRAVFAAQVEVAHDLRLPLVIHTREAMADTLAILREAGDGGVRGVFHCFTGSADEARQGLDLGFCISLSGILTFARSAALREVARLLPADRMLVETDAPYLAPVPHRGQRNEPAWVAETLRVLARERGVSAEAMAARTTANFAALIGADAGDG